MKKILVLLLVMATLFVAGCAEEQETPQNAVENPINAVESSAEPTETVRVDSSDGVQQVQVVGPVVYSSDAYWQHHNQTAKILESKIGKDVEIYLWGMKYRGELIEVDGFYVRIEDDMSGDVYIDIDAISSIAA